MKILVLRIYNSTYEYDIMRDLHMQNDDSIFVCYNETLKEPWRYYSDKRLIELRGKDSQVPGMLDKSIKALEICMGLFNFDILVRSNISTIIDLQELQTQLHDKSSVYGGHSWILDWHDWKFGIDEAALSKYRYTEFISGTSIVLSRDNCEFILENKHKLDYSIVDDVSIGVLMKEKHGPNFRSWFIESSTPVKNVCFYRFCTPDRIGDTVRMKELYSLFEDKARNNVHRF